MAITSTTTARIGYGKSSGSIDLTKKLEGVMECMLAGRLVKMMGGG